MWLRQWDAERERSRRISQERETRCADGSRKRAMNDNDLKMKLREPLRRITSPPFAMEDVARRARGLRVRRVFASGLAVAVVAAGIAVPLWALSSVGGDHLVLPGAAQAVDRFGIT